MFTSLNADIFSILYKQCLTILKAKQKRSGVVIIILLSSEYSIKIQNFHIPRAPFLIAS